MKKAKSWIILIVTFYFIFLIWTLPVKYVVSSLEQFKVLPPPDVFSVTGIEGAWTSGCMMKMKAGNVELDNLCWSWQPSGLLFGRIKFALAGDFANGPVSGKLAFGKNSVELQQMQGKIPVDSLGRVYFPGVELSGVLGIENLSLDVRDGFLTAANGQLAWLDAKVNSPYQMELGGVMIDFSTENDGILYKVVDLGGSLQVSGLGQLSPQGKYSIDGSVGARKGSSPELATFLQILGRPGADGLVTVKYNGQIGRLF